MKDGLHLGSPLDKALDEWYQAVRRCITAHKRNWGIMKYLEEEQKSHMKVCKILGIRNESRSHHS